MHSATITTNSTRNQNLIGQAFGALAWGAFFVLTSWEILLLGAILWLPLVIYFERTIIKHYGAWPGLFMQAGIVAAVVIAAAKAPLKFEDQLAGPLPKVEMTLSELKTAGIIDRNDEVELESALVTFPSTTPTNREVIESINQQTGFHAHHFTCGNGANILFGKEAGRISVVKRR